MPQTILVANHKGGVGKTMLSLHIAAAATQLGKRTVAIDTDPQASLARWHSRSRVAGRPCCEVHLMQPMMLHRELPKLGKNHDVVVIDTAPSYSDALAERAQSADLIVVPVTPSVFETDALASTLGMVPKERTLLVLNRSDTSRLTATVRKLLESLAPRVGVVRDYVAFREVTASGGSVLDRYPEGPAAHDVRRLARGIWS
jgi:chromosome partitioning protein